MNSNQRSGSMRLAMRTIVWVINGQNLRVRNIKLGNEDQNQKLEMRSAEGKIAIQPSNSESPRRKSQTLRDDLHLNSDQIRQEKSKYLLVWAIYKVNKHQIIRIAFYGWLPKLAAHKESKGTFLCDIWPLRVISR